MKNLSRKQDDHIQTCQDISNIDDIIKDALSYIDIFPDGEKNAVKLFNLSEPLYKNIYAIILKTLTQLDFEDDEAREHWKSMLKHRREMFETLNRDIGIKVAAFDYFLNINKKFVNPRIIETSEFLETQKNSLTDSLTGLYNFHFFNITLNKEIERSKRKNTPFALMLIDIDNFKQLNDIYGHQNGDMVLKAISKTMIQAVRAPDTVFRYGGEEFVVIFPDTDKEGAYHPAERIRLAIKESKYENIKIPNSEKVTVSCGIASFPIDADEKSDLIKKADKALYYAKFKGKDMVQLYEVEQRRYFRVNLIRDMTYENIIPSKAKSTGKLQNISEGGICFLSRTPLKIGSNIRVVIPIDERFKFLDLLGKVVRIIKLKNGRIKYKYRVGLEFININDECRTHLKSLVSYEEVRESGKIKKI